MNAHCPMILLLVLLAMATVAGAFELKEVRYRTENAGSVIFSHNNHLKQKSIRNNCKLCHPATSKKIPRVSMVQMEQGTVCGGCHDGKKAFALANCVGCHKIKELKLRADSFGAISFSHRGHAARQRCESCHNQLFKTGKNPSVGMAGMKSGKSCGACHNAKIAFGLEKCTPCHPLKEAVYRIAGAGTVRFSHEFHLGLYQCRDCHQQIFTSNGRRQTLTMADMAGGKSCGACHNGNTAFTVQENCARCHTMK